jgi:5-(carboxyamino)imidazole ribonucleotide synthase
MTQVTGMLPPNATIGIVGGGQLGRMSAMAAARLGYRCHILTPEADSPAGQVAAGVTRGDYSDPAALRAFAASVDVITFEFENVSAKGLDLLASLKPVRPGPAVLRISQDRVTEKSFINGAGAPSGHWMPVNTEAELRTAMNLLRFPAVLKTTRLGYDGRGQAIIRCEADGLAAFKELAPAPFILEAFVDFACEISVIVARGQDGTVVAFDAVENQHRNHILNLTLAPARITPDIAAEAQSVAIGLARALGLVGLLAVEMFVAEDGRVLVNELAPRPHNSGHWTIEACPVSQFEMHIRAVAGLPLPPAMRHSDAVMRNLVGPDDLALWPRIVATPGLIPHLYGKTEAPAGRKMGHVTRLFPLGALPGPFGVAAALGVLSSGSPDGKLNHQEHQEHQERS